MGGGGFTPDFCENTILRYALTIVARTSIYCSFREQNCPLRPWSKNGAKNQILNLGDIAKFFNPFDLSRRASHFSVFVCQNWMKNGHVMTVA